MRNAVTKLTNGIQVLALIIIIGFVVEHIGYIGYLLVLFAFLTVVNTLHKESQKEEHKY